MVQMICVATEVVLFDRSWSSVALVVEAGLVMVCGPGTSTTIWTLREVPRGVAPAQVQVTVAVPSTAGVVQAPPALGVADLNSVTAGSVSDTVTSVALDGPALVEVTV